jgi:predicted Zn-dependent protease
VLVAAVALASALIVLWLPRPQPGPDARVPATASNRADEPISAASIPAVAEPAQNLEPASAVAPAELEQKPAPPPPATALPSPVPAELASAKLDDRQLLQLFALEQPAAMIPTCPERLGDGSQYSGKSPAQSMAQLKAARREMMRGKPDSAHALLCGATAHDPTNVGAQQTLAELTLQLGDPAQAKGAVERALEQSPDNATLLALLGDAVALLGDIPGSRRIWLDTLPNGGTEADRTRRLASSYRLMGDRASKSSSFAQARNYYRRALILTEGGFAPSLGLSESLMWLGHVQASLAWAERAAQTFPKDSRVQVLFGDALYQNGQLDRARAAWQAALDVQPNNSTAARRLIQGKP